MSQHWETGPTHFELCLYPDKFLKQEALNSKGSGRSLISPGGIFMSPGTVVSALSPPGDSTFGQSHINFILFDQLSVKQLCEYFS